LRTHDKGSIFPEETVTLTSKTGLDNRLNGYFATLRSSFPGNALKHTAANWQMYAAVTGSALAMATNASAGVIYSGIQDLTVGPVSARGTSLNSGGSSMKTGFRKIALKNATGAPIGRSFSFGAYQRLVVTGGSGGHVLNGAAELKSDPVGFFLSGPDNFVKDFAKASNISAGVPEGGTVKFATQRLGPDGTNSQSGWKAGKIGYAGFQFSTAGHGLDVGWVRLEYTIGPNGLASDVEALDWAYNSTPGAPIPAGTGIPPTPEPSTGALALLAAGAAGVTALRRRRRSGCTL
jgi:hypothetical protein